MVTGWLWYPVTTVSLWVKESPAVFPTYLRDRQTLEYEQTLLKQKLDALAGADLTIARLTEDNLALRGATGDASTPRRLAEIVARPPFLAYDLLQINQGGEAGISVGAPVYLGADIVVGVVVQVGSRHAFVQLVSSPNFLSTVYLPAARIAATMEGQGGGALRVRVPQGVRVSPGDAVISLAYAPGIYGLVSQVESIPEQPEQYAYVQLPESLQSLRYVAVGDRPTASLAPEALASSTAALVSSFFYRPEVVPLLSTSTSHEATSSTEAVPASGV